MAIFYTVLALLLGGGLTALLLGKRDGALIAASCAAASASILGFFLALFPLLSGASLSSRLPLPLPLGDCLFHIDPLASMFLLPFFLIAAAGAVLMPERMRALAADDMGAYVHYGRHGFFFCLLILAMVLVLTASDAVFFLISWEIMSLSPFFIISPQDRDSKERYATWIYLVAAHLGALPLLLLFAGMSIEVGSSEFSAFAAFAASNGWREAGLFFMLALVGFGVKAGLVPLHMWMPEAHASAPGHVAVLLSGTMLNLGLYGIMRTLSLLGPMEVNYTYVLMGAGAFSGILGILIGLAQSDIKRTLAYSSAENMGIICLALGAGLLACLKEIPVAGALLLGGAFIHIWNHSVFKSLLFLGANAVKESIHITTIQRLGGLQKRIPITGGCFALGCAAIAGIPPLNGFMSEMLMYMGFALGSQAVRGTWTSLGFWGAFVVLGIIAGLALFAFTRMYGLAFLGEPRSMESRLVKEPEPLFRGVMAVLASLCLLISLAGPFLFKLLAPFVAWFVKQLSLPLSFTLPDMTTGNFILQWYAIAGLLLIALFGLAYFLRKKAVEKNGEESSPTWDCGYRYPTARMQYTGGSFANTLALMLRPLLRPHIEIPKVEGLFPSETRAVMTVPDWPTSFWERWLFSPIAQAAKWAKALQHGLINVYILYIFIALMASLIWALGWS